MIIDLRKELGGKVTNVIHVGAHEGQEMDFYFDIGANSVLWYEANPNIYNRLLNRISSHLYSERQYAKNLAVSDVCGKIKFNISNNDGSSSSILDLKEHKKYYPYIHYENSIEIDSVRLDDEIESGFNALFIDVQGAEYKVLVGGERILREEIKYVYTEVNFEELYAGCETMAVIDSYLGKLGFRRTHLVDTGHGWGDALYQK